MPPVDGVLRAMLIDALEVMLVSPKSAIQAVKLLLIKIFPCVTVSAWCSVNDQILTLFISE